MSEFHHVPVLMEEVLTWLAPRPGGTYVDATLGGAGHARAVLERIGPEGRLIAFDRDPRARAVAAERLAEFGARVRIVAAPFGELADRLAEVLDELELPGVDGILADIGVSSPQLDDPARGFSFRESGPIDMRMDTSAGETALELIERLEERELADVLFEYGEERKSFRVAGSIKRALAAGELATTLDLQRAVQRALGRPPGRKGHRRIDPATRTFQALRIAVNGELTQLERLIDAAPDFLVSGGRLVIISFHSLEDRIVKHRFRGDARLRVLTKRPLVATEGELADNPRAKPSKLRAAERLAPEGDDE